MQKCGNCGQEASRCRVTFDQKGDPVLERCQHCAPEEFDDPFRMPTDQRIYTGPEAYPNRYKRDRNDVFQATDELIADTAALWDEGPTARAVKQKARTRRTDPLTPDEIAASKRWGEQVLAPIIREHGVAGLAGALNKAQDR